MHNVNHGEIHPGELLSNSPEVNVKLILGDINFFKIFLIFFNLTIDAFVDLFFFKFFFEKESRDLIIRLFQINVKF